MALVIPAAVRTLQGNGFRCTCSMCNCYKRKWIYYFI